MSEEKAEAETVYPIRITGPAADDVTQAVEYLADVAGEPYATEWEQGFFESVRTLSNMPRKHLIAQQETQRFGFEVRKLLYQRPKGKMIYLIFFTIQQEKDDPPFVRILHVRHGARRSISNKEVKELRQILKADEGSE